MVVSAAEPPPTSQDEDDKRPFYFPSLRLDPHGGDPGDPGDHGDHVAEDDLPPKHETPPLLGNLNLDLADGLHGLSALHPEVPVFHSHHHDHHDPHHHDHHDHRHHRDGEVHEFGGGPGPHEVPELPQPPPSAFLVDSGHLALELHLPDSSFADVTAMTIEGIVHTEEEEGAVEETETRLALDDRPLHLIPTRLISLKEPPRKRQKRSSVPEALEGSPISTPTSATQAFEGGVQITIDFGMHHGDQEIAANPEHKAGRLGEGTVPPSGGAMAQEVPQSVAEERETPPPGSALLSTSAEGLHQQGESYHTATTPGQLESDLSHSDFSLPPSTPSFLVDFSVNPFLSMPPPAARTQGAPPPLVGALLIPLQRNSLLSAASAGKRDPQTPSSQENSPEGRMSGDDHGHYDQGDEDEMDDKEASTQHDHPDAHSHEARTNHFPENVSREQKLLELARRKCRCTEKLEVLLQEHMVWLHGVGGVGDPAERGEVDETGRGGPSPPPPKQDQRGPRKNLALEDAWFIAHLFDEKGKLPYCVRCVRVVFQLGNPRLKRLREQVATRQNNVHGLTGRPGNHSKNKFVLEAFLAFVDAHTTTPTPSGPPFFNHAFRRIQTPSAKQLDVMSEADRSQSLVYKFNQLQGERLGEKISNGTASNWLRKYRPRHRVFPKTAEGGRKPMLVQETPLSAPGSPSQATATESPLPQPVLQGNELEVEAEAVALHVAEDEDEDEDEDSQEEFLIWTTHSRSFHDDAEDHEEELPLEPLESHGQDTQDDHEPVAVDM